MTQVMNDPVAQVKTIYGYFGSQDWEKFAAALHEDIVWSVPEGASWFTKATYEGPGEVMKGFLPELGGAFEDMQLKPISFEACGDNVYVRGTLDMTKDGAITSVPFCHFITMKDGKYVRFQAYNDTATMNRLVK